MPLELLRDAAAIPDQAGVDEVRARLARLVAGADDADQLVEMLAGVLRASEQVAAAEEIAWAARRLLATLAGRGPLVILVDDVQWAETVFTELLASLPRLVRDVPLLVVCLARPELLEQRPEWRETGLVVLLDPLGAGAAAALVEELAGPPLPDVVARHIVHAGGGNPLFVEELLGDLVESGALRREDDVWLLAVESSQLALPPSLDALLGGRLDRLPEPEQDVLERASIEGEVFHLGSVQALVSGPPDASREALQSLVVRDVITETGAAFAHDRAFRFRHLLIRDAAYRRLPKAIRAALHEVFANWLEERAGERAAEYEEVVGYHLEQAYELLRDLGRLDDDGRRLGERAGVLLARSGRVAMTRGDVGAASTLLRRAAALMPAHGAARGTVLVDLAESLAEHGELAQAEAVLDDVIGRGDRQLDALAVMPRVALYFFGRGNLDAVAERRRLEDAYNALDGDDLARARAARTLAWLDLVDAQSGAMQAHLDVAMAHARRAGSSYEVSEILYMLPMLTVFGPTPRDEAVAQCQAWLQESAPVSKLRALTLGALGCLEAMDGRFDEARALVAAQLDLLNEQLGMHGMAASGSSMLGDVDALAGDYAAAEERHRATLSEYQRRGMVNHTTLAELVTVVLEQGRVEEALALADEIGAVDVEDDVDAAVRWYAARACAHARRGEAAVAEQLARTALAQAERVDMWELSGLAHTSLAEALECARRLDEARAQLELALRLYQRKPHRVLAERTRARLERLGNPTRRD